ncbi:hypothetical protein J3F83DRAFT_225887 [Trichoderma novae-zelandiae]
MDGATQASLSAAHKTKQAAPVFLDFGDPPPPPPPLGVLLHLTCGCAASLQAAKVDRGRFVPKSLSLSLPLPLGGAFLLCGKIDTQARQTERGQARQDNRYSIADTRLDVSRPDKKEEEAQSDRPLSRLSALVFFQSKKEKHHRNKASDGILAKISLLPTGPSLRSLYQTLKKIAESGDTDKFPCLPPPFDRPRPDRRQSQQLRVHNKQASSSSSSIPVARALGAWSLGPCFGSVLFTGRLFLEHGKGRRSTQKGAGDTKHERRRSR